MTDEPIEDESTGRKIDELVEEDEDDIEEDDDEIVDDDEVKG